MSQPPAIYDAYGKAIQPGDTILYPVIEQGPSHHAAMFVEMVVVSLDAWVWTKEWCDKFGYAYDSDLPPGFVLTAVEATDYVTINDPDDMFRHRIGEPSKAIIITGLDLTKRYQTPKADRKGYWSRPGRG